MQSFDGDDIWQLSQYVCALGNLDAIEVEEIVALDGRHWHAARIAKLVAGAGYAVSTFPMQ